MLKSVLTFLAEEVNLYLIRRTGAGQNLVEAGGIATEDGKWAVPTGMLRLALVSIEEERIMRSQVPQRTNINGSQVVLQPDIKLNLVLVLAARVRTTDATDDTLNPLSYLSHAITFFQAHPSFSSQQYPGLDPRIEKLTVEMVTHGPEQLNQLWAYIGAKYLPSVVYRVRMLVLQDLEPLGIGKPIMDIDERPRQK